MLVKKVLQFDREEVVFALQDRIHDIATDLGYEKPHNGVPYKLNQSFKLRTKTKHYNAGRLDALMSDMSIYDVMISKDSFDVYKKVVATLGR